MHKISSGSLHYKRSKRIEVIITSMLISSCHGLSRPRTTDEQGSHDEDKIITYDARQIRPEYKSFMEDVLNAEETLNSMSLSFDFSGSFKSLVLEDKGDKSLAAEWIDNINIKNSFEATSCNALGVAAAQTIALDYCPSSTAEIVVYDPSSYEQCKNEAISVCEAYIYGYIQDYGCGITTSQLLELQGTCEETLLDLSTSTVVPLVTPIPTPAISEESPPPTPLTTPSPIPNPTSEPTNEPTKEPTREPTKEPTESPSYNPTESPITSSPSKRPTLYPSKSPTQEPTRDPTQNPTDSPTESPTNSPSGSPTTMPPTQSPVEGPQPTDSPSTSFRPSNHPSLEPSSSSPTLSPSTAEPSPSPTRNPSNKPTPTPTAPLRIYSVPTGMIFYTSDRFKGPVLETWKRVTGERIKKHTLITIEEEGVVVRDCRVNLNIVSQSNLEINQVRLRALSKDADTTASTKTDSYRFLQASTKPLLVNYTTEIQFYSMRSDWDTTKFVGSGFVTNSQQRSYMFQLKAADTNNFEEIAKFQMEVDGTVVTEKPEPVEPIPEDNSTLIWAIIGAAAGTLATGFLIGTAIYVRRKNRRNNSGKSSAGEAFPDVENSTKSETKPQASSYFGTIESREGEQDDVSTLGDPYFGEAVNAVMDRDDTVAESMISAEADMYVYGVGRPRLDTGTSSRMDTTISGRSGAKMMFSDDPTLDDVYKTPAMNIYEEDENSQRLTVVAPNGKLGIVIDNPGGDIPIVHAIKETSALYGRIKVGDSLLSVDEKDCRGMSAVAVSKLISSRSDNPSRTFVILRGGGGV